MNGFFLGGLLSGAEKGIRIGTQLGKAFQDRQAYDLRQQGMEEARQAHELEVNGQITNNGVMPTPQSNQEAAASPSTAPGADDAPGAATPSATPIAVASPEGQAPSVPLAPQGQPQPEAPAATPQQQQSSAAENGLPTYSVGGQVYTDPAKARAAAEKSATSTTDLFIKNSAAKMRDFYVQQGDIETADKWDKWAESSQNKAGMKLWAGAYTAAQAGDWDTAADKFGKYYTDIINDGVDYVGHKNVLGDDGKLVGFSVQLKDQKTGKQSELQLTPQSMLQMGMANNPQTLFASEMKKRAGVDAAKAKIAEENVKQRGRIELEGVKAGHNLEREVTKSNLEETKPGEIGKKARDLKSMGWSQDRIDNFLSNSEHKKTTDPAERRALIYSDAAKNNSRWSRMSEDERSAEVDKAMRVIYKGSVKSGEEKPSASPAASGITPPSSSNAGKLPVWDEKTNKMIYR